jgi:hypothetical protein
MAGYSGKPLAAKLGIKDGFRIGIVNEPDGIRRDLGDLSAVTLSARLQSPLDLILFFVTSQSELKKGFSKLASKLAPAGMLWVAWPKKASSVPTDLSDNSVREIGLAAGLVDVKVCAVDETWSGLKFVIRLKDRRRQST